MPTHAAVGRPEANGGQVDLETAETESKYTKLRNLKQSIAFQVALGVSVVPKQLKFCGFFFEACTAFRKANVGQQRWVLWSAKSNQKPKQPIYGVAFRMWLNSILGFFF